MLQNVVNKKRFHTNQRGVRDLIKTLVSLKFFIIRYEESVCMIIIIMKIALVTFTSVG